MTRKFSLRSRTALVVLGVLMLGAFLGIKPSFGLKPPSSYAPVVIQEDFDKTVAKMSAAKPEIMDRQMKLLEERYDLSDRPAKGVTVSGQADPAGRAGKTARRSVTVGRFGRDDARGDSSAGAVAKGFLPLPHPNHPKAVWCFPNTRLMRSRSRKGAT